MKSFTAVLLLFLVVATGWVTFSPAKAYACSCVAMSMQEKMNHYEAVFAGKAMDRGVASFFRFGETRAYSFEVQRAWKGVGKKRITIQSLGGGSSSCGFAFKRNKTYLVFASYDANRKLQTSLCSGNMKLANADEAITILGDEGIDGKELTGRTGTASTPSLNLFLYIAAVVLIAAAARYGWKIYRRRRSP